jgi:hypothetical protein
LIDGEKIEKKYDPIKQVAIRKRIHVLMSLVLIIVIIIFKYVIADATVIAKLFTYAGYTYGPLLGLYAFGLFTNWNIKDKIAPIIAIAAPILGYIISYLTNTFLSFEWGFFILILNGSLTFLGLILIRTKQD